MHRWWCTGRSRAPEIISRRRLVRPSECEQVVAYRLHFNGFRFEVHLHLVVLTMTYLGLGATTKWWRQFSQFFFDDTTTTQQRHNNKQQTDNNKQTDNKQHQYSISISTQQTSWCARYMGRPVSVGAGNIRHSLLCRGLVPARDVQAVNKGSGAN